MIFSYICPNVCDKITDMNVIFDESGSIGIKCFDCDRIVKLSSSVHKQTGKISFTAFNFVRHHSNAHSNHEAVENMASSENGESSMQSETNIKLDLFIVSFNMEFCYSANWRAPKRSTAREGRQR